MKVALRAISLVACTAFLLAVSSTAHASSFTATGEVWENGTTDNVPAAGSAVYSSTPTAVFTIDGLSATNIFNFNSNNNGGADYTLSNFLTSGGDTNLTYLSGAGAGGDSINNDLFQFSGTTTLADGTYTFSHDDGLILYLNGTMVVDNGGPTSAETTNLVVCSSGAGCTNNSDCPSGSCTFVSSGGTYNFVLDYAEVDGAPAVLTTDLPLMTTSITPEPSSFIMLGSGLLAAAGMMRRRLMA